MTDIQTERRRQSMTQKRLAFEAGIDARTLRKIEKGEQVSPESYRAVCRVLGISLLQDRLKGELSAACDAPLATELSRMPLKDCPPQEPAPRIFGDLPLILLAIGILGGAGYLMYQDDLEYGRDVLFVVESKRHCDTGWGDDLVPRVKKALPSVDVRDITPGMGTTTCEIKFAGKTEATGAEVATSLASAGLRQRILWSRY